MKMKRIAVFLLLLLSLSLTACGEKAPTLKEQPKPQVQETAEDKVKVTLYFGNEQADGLVSEVREIDKPGDMVVALISELTKPGKHAAVLPEGTELVYYQKEGDTIILNFNKAFANLQGSTGEFIAINAVVNTITELPEFNKVMLQVDRQPLSTGHAIYDKPLTRDESMIKK
ncbi:GerMN domain-containing protein [Desulforamulus ruminis]|uniref:Lipoprotein LpqB, GerMN domain protein n=1 Tax=Desulforamulus ruminis (strain ATCC 23193 / DSM 2154 / NCIMB 8452 / DL) TaxID=696281 RepID=F6DV81_DESRL|nr:GerMN domain-containing protein [Desulforamulus ruminis]AEG59147.1 Lipoprotein LpqB, GerMN domain protein [Desulforamulus ruminis DSM 2154]